MTLTRLATTRDVPLAAVPLVFAAQQALEGALWLCLGHVWPSSYEPALANGFVLVALSVWPWLVPLAVALVEDDERAGAVIGVFVPVGALLATYLAVTIARHPFGAEIDAGTICYVNDRPLPTGVLAIYFACTCAPWFLSTDRVLRLVGAVVVAGLFVSITLFHTSFVSVWCFFAAAASVGIYVKLARDRIAPMHYARKR